MYAASVRIVHVRMDFLTCWKEMTIREIGNPSSAENESPPGQFDRARLATQQMPVTLNICRGQTKLRTNWYLSRIISFIPAGHARSCLCLTQSYPRLGVTSMHVAAASTKPQRGRHGQSCRSARLARRSLDSRSIVPLQKDKYLHSTTQMMCEGNSQEDYLLAAAIAVAR